MRLLVGTRKIKIYTGETQPVEWVRVHNLPDLVYFNHSQHVEVGAELNVRLVTGPVEEMEIVSQYSPLTMGWCVNCHRDTNVKVEGNEYYAKIHEELSKKYGVRSSFQLPKWVDWNVENVTINNIK